MTCLQTPSHHKAEDDSKGEGSQPTRQCVFASFFYAPSSSFILQFLQISSLFTAGRCIRLQLYKMQPIQDLFLIDWGCFRPDGMRGRCYVHMLNPACLSPFSVPCHRYHLTQELFGGQLFRAIESISKPAPCFVFYFVTQCSAPSFSSPSVSRCLWN